MLPLLFVALFQTVADGQTPSRDARPVRVWLGSTGPLIRGTPVRVYVQAAQDGDLIVLHRRTDGRIEVLFPSNPKSDPFVRAGTYEIRGTGEQAAWVVSEPDGTGLILAALSSDQLRFDEFVRRASWNPDALAPTWHGSDGEGALSDIVQRMLGDGYFNYDLVKYTVAPPVYAQQLIGPQNYGQQPDTVPTYAQQSDTMQNYGSYPVCVDCTFIYGDVIIGRSRGHGGRQAQRDQGICGIHEPCAESQKTHAISLAVRPGAQAQMAPSPTSPVMPRPRAPSDPIQPRPRASTGSLAATSPRMRGTTAASAPLRHVRYTSLSTPESERPAASTELLARGGDGRTMAIPREAMTGAARGASAQVPGGSGLEPRNTVARRAAAASGAGTAAARQSAGPGAAVDQTPARTRSLAVAGGRAATGPSQGVAIPGNVGRGGSTHFGVRRR